MLPVPLLFVVAVLLAAMRVVWWLAARDRIMLRTSEASASEASASEATTVGDCPPAVAALVLSGANGGACYLLDEAASAGVANLVARGVLLAGTDGDDAWFSLEKDDDLTADDALLLHLLRTRMSRTADGSELVNSGTIAHHQPSVVWWLRYRRAVALRARDLGLTRSRTSLGMLFGIAAGAGLIGVAGVAAGLLSFVQAFRALDPLVLNLWWPFVGVIALRVGSDALRTAIERSDVLTAAGRNYTVRLAHRRDQLLDSVGPTDGVDGLAPVSMATALGIHTRVSRQVPLVSAQHDRLIWSDHSGSLRLVRVRRDWRPGEGARPSSAVLGGIFAIAVAIIIQRIEALVSGSDWFSSLASESPSAVDNITQMLSLARQLSLVPLIGGLSLALAGVIDLFITTSISGRVIDVRLPETRHVAQRVQAFFTGAGHDGVAIVELTLDLDDAGRTRTIVVDARAAAPIGAEVLVQHTLLLRRVKSIAPRGSSGAESPSTPTLTA